MNCRWSFRAQLAAGAKLQNEIQGTPYPLTPGHHAKANIGRRGASWHHCSVGASGDSKSSNNRQAHAAAVTANGMLLSSQDLLSPGAHSSAWLDGCNCDISQLHLHRHQQYDVVQPVKAAGCDNLGSSNKPTAPPQQLTSSSNGHNGIPFNKNGACSLRVGITQSIKSCATWQELDVIVREYGPAFNHIHISAAITHLAQLHSNRPALPVCHPEHQHEVTGDNVQLVHGLTDIMQQMARQHQQVQLSLGGQLLPEQQQQQQASTASVQLMSTVQHEQQRLLQQLLAQAVLQLPLLQSRQVANIMWSLAQLRYCWQASEQTAAPVTALLSRAAELFGASEGRHLASTAYAAAKLQLPLSPDWLEGLQDAWLRHMKQCRQRGQPMQQQHSLAVKAHCGSGAGRNAGRSSIRTGQLSSQEAFSPQAAANLLWALSHLQQQRQQPSQAWLQQVVDGVAADLQQWPAKSVAVFLFSCAKLGYNVAHKLQQDPRLASNHGECQQQRGIERSLVHALHHHSQSFSRADVAQILWAAAVMRLQLPGPLLHQLMEAGAKGLQLEQQRQQQPKNSVKLGSSCSSSHQATASPAGSGSAAGVAHSVSLVLWSLARLGVTPRHQLPPRLLQPWLEALVACSSAADSQSLATAAWALGHMQLVGSCPRVVQAIVQAATQSLQQQQYEVQQDAPPGSGGAGVSVSGRAVASLAWAAAHYNKAAALAAQHGGSQQYMRQQQSQLLPNSLRAEPGGEVKLSNRRQTAMATASSHTPGTAEALQQSVRLLLLTAAGTQLVTKVSSANYQAEAVAAVPGASLQDMSQVLWAVSAMRLELPGGWWHQCLAQLTALVQQQQKQLPQQHSNFKQEQQFAQSLAVTVWALGQLRVRVSKQLMGTLQTASSQLLRQDNPTVLSAQGYVMLLLGFTHICTAAACRFQRFSRHPDTTGQHNRAKAYQSQQVDELGTVEACFMEPNAVKLHQCDGVYGSMHQRKQQQQRQWRQHRWVTHAGVSPEWLHQWCISVENQLHHLPLDGLVAVLWALGRLRYHPGSEFLDVVLQRLLVVLLECSARHLALIMWALTRLQHVPSEAITQQVLQAWEPLIASASKADTQQMCWAIEKLREWSTVSNLFI